MYKWPLNLHEYKPSKRKEKKNKKKRCSDIPHLHASSEADHAD
jgi:hypothetical protein